MSAQRTMSQPTLPERLRAFLIEQAQQHPDRRDDHFCDSWECDWEADREASLRRQAGPLIAEALIALEKQR